MSHQYLSIYPCSRYSRSDTCIIGLNSCSDLREVLKYVRRNSDIERFIFIGNNGIQSRALQSLISVESNQGLNCYEKFRHCSGVSDHTAIDVLLGHRGMDSYSHQAKRRSVSCCSAIPCMVQPCLLEFPTRGLPASGTTDEKTQSAKGTAISSVLSA